MAYTLHAERVRGFQPPWYTVLIYSCDCGRTTRLRPNWRGPAPRGAIRCDCGAQLNFPGPEGVRVKR